MNRGVAVIWWGMLLATVFGVVPVVLGLLTRALAAARSIERYTAEILQSGVGIAGNTASAAALKDTIAAAPLLVEGAASIEGHAATIRAALGGETPTSASAVSATEATGDPPTLGIAHENLGEPEGEATP